MIIDDIVRCRNRKCDKIECVRMFSRIEADGETFHKVDNYNEKNKDTCEMYLVEEIIGNKKYEKKPVH